MTGVSVLGIGQRLGGLFGKALPFASRTPTEPRADSALAAMQRARDSLSRLSEGAHAASATTSITARKPRSSVRPTAAFDHPDAARPSLASADWPVTAGEVAAALGDGMVPRLVVLSPVRKRRAAASRAAGALRLAKAMADRGLSTIVIDLRRGSEIDRTNGQGLNAFDLERAGLGDWLRGDVELTEAIHRDPESRVHLVPAGGFDFLDAEDVDIADLVFFVVACCGVLTIAS